MCYAAVLYGRAKVKEQYLIWHQLAKLYQLFPKKLFTEPQNQYRKK